MEIKHMESQKEKKIDVAIRDIKVNIENAERKRMLLNQEIDTMKKLLDTLEIIRDNKHLE